MAKTIAELEVKATGDVGGAKTALNDLDGSVNNSSANTKKAGLAFMGAGLAIAAGFGLSINVAANFEQAIANIGAVAGLTGPQMDQVRRLALQLGADTSFSASEAAAAMEVLLKAGMPIKTVLNGGAKAALDLAAASGGDVVTAAELMTSAYNVFGQSIGSAAHVASLFNAAANVSAADLNSLQLGFAMAALPAKNLGIGLTDLVASLALFSQNGLQGSDAGTSFKTMLIALANPTNEAKDLMTSLGLSFFDAQGNFIGVAAMAQQLKEKLGPLTQEQRAAALATIFGSDAQRAATIFMNEGAAGVNNMKKEMAGIPSAADQAASRMSTLKGQMETLKGSIETIEIVIGTMFLPTLTTLATKATELVNKFMTLDPAVQKNISTIAGVAAAALILVGALGMVGSVMGPVAAGFGLLLSPIGLVVLAIAGLFIAYQTNFLGFADGVNAGVAKVKAAFDAAKPTIDAVARALGAGFQAALPMLTAALDIAKTAVGGMVDAIKTYINGEIEFFKGAFQIIHGIFTGDWGEIKDGVVNIVTGLKDMVVGIFQALMTAFTAQMDVTKLIGTTAFNALKDSMVNLATSAKDGVVRAFQSMLDGVKALFQATRDNAISILTGLASSAYAEAVTIGTQIGGGIIAGINQMWDSVMNFAGALAGAVADKIKGALHIFSPSRVTAEFGRMVGAGLIVGMEASRPDVTAKAGHLAQAVTTPIAAAAAAPAPMSAISNRSASVVNHITVNLKELKELVELGDFLEALPRERQLALGGV